MGWLFASRWMPLASQDSGSTFADLPFERTVGGVLACE
jgi:hypothetical protein